MGRKDKARVEGKDGKASGEKTLNDKIKKRSVVVGKHKTAVSLEDAFWYPLNEMAKKKGIYKSRLLAQIDEERGDITLSSACRQYVLREMKACGS